MPRIRATSLATIALMLLAVAGFALFTIAGTGRGALTFDTDLQRRLPEFVSEVYDSTVIQLFIVMIGCGLILERVIPARNEPPTNAPLNLVYGALVLLFAASLLPIQATIVRSGIEAFGWRGLFDLKFDTETSLPLAFAAMAVSAFALDFFFYWFHRLQHSSLLWPQHLLHHSDTALNVTTTQRAHFLEHLMIPFFMTLPLVLLFNLPTTDVIWIAAVPAAWAYFAHMNVRVSFGPLWWLLTSPQYPRIHHSLEPKHFDRNFALWFPIWDLVFGTAYRPLRGEYPATGVAGVEVTSLPQSAILPFVGWYRMLADGLRRLKQSS